MPLAAATHPSLALHAHHLATFARFNAATAYSSALVAAHGDDVTWSVVPTVRSGYPTPNIVVYHSGPGLLAAQAAVTDIYRTMAVSTWRILVPDLDDPTADTLRRNPQYRIGEPLAAMSCTVPLTTAEPLRQPYTADAKGKVTTLGAINDAASQRCNAPQPRLSTAFDRLPHTLAVTVYRVKHRDKAVSAVAAIDTSGPDGHPLRCLAWLATHPDHQRKGCATHLIQTAVADTTRARHRTVVALVPPRAVGLFERVGFLHDITYHQFERR